MGHPVGRRRIRAAIGLLVLPILMLGCAGGGTSQPAHESQAAQPGRSLREKLFLGPDSLDTAGRRFVWAGIVGTLTLPVWLPWLSVEGVRSVIRGDPIFVMELRSGRVGFRHRADLAGVGAQPPEGLVPPDIDFGSYHALLIGNNHYRHLTDLRTAINDAQAVASLLRDAYEFETRMLLDATRADIVHQLFEMRRTLSSEENLLIYYAGHGQLDDDTGEGYWLPVDASAEDPANWLANSTISTMLKAIPARHILLVVDSCFSGSLNRSARRMTRPDHVEKLVSKRARMVMTSGGLEPVEDAGGRGHSVFARSLLQVLESNAGVLDGSSVFLEIRRSVGNNAYQTPEYAPIRFTGHDGGDFLFVRRAGSPPK